MTNKTAHEWAEKIASACYDGLTVAELACVSDYIQQAMDDAAAGMREAAAKECIAGDLPKYERQIYEALADCIRSLPLASENEGL
ncbi:MAG: hypothetical protein IKE42_28530 [Aquamicrobium sp.]|nr:hypothetical protein [Aquamicrobium sp.]